MALQLSCVFKEKGPGERNRRIPKHFSSQAFNTRVVNVQTTAEKV